LFKKHITKPKLVCLVVFFLFFIELDFFAIYFFLVFKKIDSKKNHVIKLYKTYGYVHRCG
jgi:hypothetical protein